MCLETVRQLQACTRDSRALSHAISNGRTQDATKVGLAHMPAVEPTIAALIVFPNEALRQDVRCPPPRYRVTDDFLSKAYDAAARMGRIGNSMSPLMFTLSASISAELQRCLKGTVMSDVHIHPGLPPSMACSVVPHRGVQKDPPQCSGGAGGTVWVSCSRGIRVDRPGQADQAAAQQGCASPQQAQGHFSCPAVLLSAISFHQRPQRPAQHPTQRSGQDFQALDHLPSRQPRAFDTNRHPPRAFKDEGTGH